MSYKTLLKKKPGTPYEGRATFSTDYSLVPRPGFYAMDEEGKTVYADIPLVMVDDEPMDDNGTACHLEHAGPKDNPQRMNTSVGRIVSLEATTHGQAEVDS